MEHGLKRKLIKKSKCYSCVWSKDAGLKLVCLFPRCLYVKDAGKIPSSNP